MDLWAYTNKVHLNFIRHGKPVENGYIESFNGRLRDECLNVEIFFSLADARYKLGHWRNETTITVRIQHWQTGYPRSLPLNAAVQTTAAKPPWKALRVSHAL
jgi:transposase InsO family protein